MRQQRGDVWLYRSVASDYFVSRVHPQWIPFEDSKLGEDRWGSAHHSRMTYGAALLLFGGRKNLPMVCSDLFLLRCGRVVGRWEMKL